MLYHKVSLSSGQTIVSELHEDEIFTRCPSCGLEQQVDSDLLKFMLDNGDFGSTKIYCNKCTKDRREVF